jgi:hypothetical protein
MLDARCLILDKGNRVAVQDRVGESSFATLQLRRDRSSIKYRVSRFWFIAVAFLATTSHVGAQELLPAAYTPAPYGINLLSYAITHNDGDMTFDPSAPIEDVTAKITSSALGYARTLGIAGRAANIGVVVPYVVGHLEGLYLGEPAAASRSGLGDLAFRCAVNLYGAPSMSPQEFGSYRPRTLIGVSLVVRAPTGQYMPERLLNIGGNRWAFKPEIGVVHIMGRWAIDAYLGGWFFTDNTDFFGRPNSTSDIFSNLVYGAPSTAIFGGVVRQRWTALSTMTNSTTHGLGQRCPSASAEATPCASRQAEVPSPGSAAISYQSVSRTAIAG